MLIHGLRNGPIRFIPTPTHPLIGISSDFKYRDPRTPAALVHRDDPDPPANDGPCRRGPRGPPAPAPPRQGRSLHHPRRPGLGRRALADMWQVWSRSRLTPQGSGPISRTVHPGNSAAGRLQDPHGPPARELEGRDIMDPGEALAGILDGKVRDSFLVVALLLQAV